LLPLLQLILFRGLVIVNVYDDDEMLLEKPNTDPAVDEDKKVKSLLLFVNVKNPFILLKVIVKPDMFADKKEMRVFEL
jgi:hypothetical protein